MSSRRYEAIRPIFIAVSNSDASKLNLPVREENNPCEANVQLYFTQEQIKDRYDTNSLVIINEPSPDGDANVISTDVASQVATKSVLVTHDLDYIIDNTRIAFFDEYDTTMDMNILTILHSEFDSFVKQFLTEGNKDKLSTLRTPTSFTIYRYNMGSLNNLYYYIDENKNHDESVIDSLINEVAVETVNQTISAFNSYIYAIMSADIVDYRQMCIDTGSITEEDKDISDYTCFSLVFSLLHSIASGCCKHTYELAQMNASYLVNKITNFVNQIKQI